MAHLSCDLGTCSPGASGSRPPSPSLWKDLPCLLHGYAVPAVEHTSRTHPRSLETSKVKVKVRPGLRPVVVVRPVLITRPLPVRPVVIVFPLFVRPLASV